MKSVFQNNIGIHKTTILNLDLSCSRLQKYPVLSNGYNNVCFQERIEEERLDNDIFFITNNYPNESMGYMLG